MDRYLDRFLDQMTLISFRGGVNAVEAQDWRDQTLVIEKSQKSFNEIVSVRIFLSYAISNFGKRILDTNPITIRH